jgi:branched-subunit amino acid aminotransferase/4-amino-4-deoxychorismate lyase
MTDFRLIETMRVFETGEVHLLERHLLRLRRSARHFSFKYDSEKLRDAILAAAPHQPACLRLLLSEAGEVELHSKRLPSQEAQELRLAGVRVNSRDPFLYHKTTNRRIYEEARRDFDNETDAILINERDEITETTIANIAVSRERQWITPALSCGLLPGVGRAELLARGDIVEGVILVDDLIPGEAIRCFNALRGKFDLEFKT